MSTPEDNIQQADIDPGTTDPVDRNAQLAQELLSGDINIAYIQTIYWDRVRNKWVVLYVENEPA
jgi:hypothetical protein